MTPPSSRKVSLDLSNRCNPARGMSCLGGAMSTTTAPNQAQAYLRAKSAAEYLGVSAKTLTRWVAAGRIKAHKLSSHCVVFARADIESLLADAAIGGKGGR